MILSISVGERPETVRAFVDRLGLAYPVGVDADGEISRAYAVRSTPTTYVIDAAGLLVDAREGVVSQEWIDTHAGG